MAEGSSPFGSGFLQDLSALMGGGGAAPSAPVPPAPTSGDAPSGDDGNDGFVARLRGYEDVANGRA